ncbi:hypothetical protein ACVWYN_000421 [Pedobacter sp. UYP24]
MENKRKIKPLMKKLLGGALFAGLFILNIMVFVQSEDDSGALSLSTLKAYALSGNSGEDGSGSGDACHGCKTGLTCIEGTCVQLQRVITRTCTITFFCWSTLTNKTANGLQLGCEPFPTGSTECIPVECDAQDPC